MLCAYLNIIYTLRPYTFWHSRSRILHDIYNWNPETLPFVGGTLQPTSNILHLQLALWILHCMPMGIFLVALLKTLDSAQEDEQCDSMVYKMEYKQFLFVLLSFYYYYQVEAVPLYSEGIHLLCGSQI